MNTKYVSLPYDASYDGKCVLLSSALGTGKTEVIKHWVDAYARKNVLYISYRKLLTKDIKRRIPSFEVYSDIEGPIMYNHKKPRQVICQSDSLHRILGFEMIDLFVFDEYVTLQSHICSSTEK